MPSSTNTSNKYIASFVVITLTFLMMACFASGVDLHEYPMYQYGAQSRGYISTLTGHWDEVDTTLSMGVGYNANPIIMDLDGDDSYEMVVHSGTNLDVYDKDGAQLATLTYPEVKGSIASFNISDDQYLFAVGYSGTPCIVNVSFLNFTGSALEVLSSTNLGNLGGITCGSFHAGEAKCSNDACYYTEGTGTFNRWRASKFNISGLNIDDRDLVDYNTDVGRVYESAASLSDYDNDNVDELIFRYDDDTDDRFGYIIISTDDMSIENRVDDISTDSKVYPPIFHNLDGAGTAEILFAYYDATQTRIRAYRSTGAQYWTNGEVTPHGYKGNIVMCDLGESQLSPCIYTINQTGEAYTVQCLSYDGFNELWDTDVSTTNYGTMPSSRGFNAMCADMDDDDKDEIIVPDSIIDDDGTELLALDYNITYRVSGADIDADNEIDLFFSNSVDTLIAFSDYLNEPPVINSNATYKVNFNPSLICNNTALTFSMRECGTQPCHYTNDGDDNERIVSKCNGSEYQNGTFSAADPSLSCLFTELGTFSYSVYLQDEFHNETYGQYRDFVTRVVPGTPGIDCNLPSTDAQARGEQDNGTVVEPDDEITSEEDIDYVVATLTGQSDFMNVILVLIFTVMIFLGLAKLGVQDFRVYAVSIFSAWIGFSLLKILAWIYPVILAVIFVAIGALSFASRGNSE